MLVLICCRSQTSSRMLTARPPASSISARTRCAAAPSISVTKAMPPRAAQLLAMARPMPAPAPVTKATRPENCPSGIGSGRAVVAGAEGLLQPPPQPHDARIADREMLLLARLLDRPEPFHDLAVLIGHGMHLLAVPRPPPAPAQPLPAIGDAPRPDIEGAGGILVDRRRQDDDPVDAAIAAVGDVEPQQIGQHELDLALDRPDAAIREIAELAEPESVLVFMGDAEFLEFRALALG